MVRGVNALSNWVQLELWVIIPDVKNLFLEQYL